MNKPKKVDGRSIIFQKQSSINERRKRNEFKDKG